MVIVLGISGRSFAYRPLGTEDAGVAGKGVTQMELSWDYLKWNKKDKEQIFLFVPIYGATERIELSAEIPYLVHHFEPGSGTEGIADVNLAGKYLLVPESEGSPAFTAKGVIKLDNGDFEKGLGSGDRDYSIFAVVSITVTDIIIHGQLGYTWIGKEKDPNLNNIYLYGVALDYAITEAFHMVGEINGNRHPDRTINEHPRLILLGATYKLSQKLTADFAVRQGLTNTTPDWSTTAGVSVTF